METGGEIRVSENKFGGFEGKEEGEPGGLNPPENLR